MERSERAWSWRMSWGTSGDEIEKRARWKATHSGEMRWSNFKWNTTLCTVGKNSSTSLHRLKNTRSCATCCNRPFRMRLVHAKSGESPCERGERFLLEINAIGRRLFFLGVSHLQLKYRWAVNDWCEEERESLLFFFFFLLVSRRRKHSRLLTY